jgi:hypothetical protein
MVVRWGKIFVAKSRAYSLVTPGGKPRRRAPCHPDLPHFAKELCRVCYLKQWTSPNTATCHPDRPYFVRGLCRQCDSRERMRVFSRKKIYGLSSDDYAALLAEQNGVCAICGKTPKSILYVDHNHATGSVRGLLCQDCNIGLGRFKDDIVLLEAAIKYLVSRG